MPFQGNPNAGQPDPALLNLLFQQKAQREERAYKMQQDALAAQRQAQLDAAEEARKAELHQAKLLDLRVKTANSLQSQEKQIGADQKTADQAKEQVAQQYPFVSTPGRQTPQGVEYGALPDQSIQNAYTQNQFNEQIQKPIDVRQAMLAANMAQVPGFENYGDSLPMQGRLAQATEDRTTQEAVQRDINKEGRQADIAAEADRRQARIAEIKAQNDYRRDISKTGNEIMTLETQIEEQRAIQKTAPIGSPEFKRAVTLEAKLNSAMNRKLTEGVDPGHFANVQKWMDDNVSLVQESEAAIQDAKAFLQLAETNPNFLGTTRGGLTQYINNAFEGAADIAGLTGSDTLGTLNNLSQSAARMFLSDATMTPTQRDELGRELGIGADGILQARADAKVLSARIAYMVTRLQNPGRFSNEQYADNHARMRFDKGTAAQALRNLKSAIAELEGMSARTKQRIGVYENLQPGALGGLVGTAGQEVLPPSAPTPFSSLTPQQPAAGGNMPPVKFGTSGLPLIQPTPKPGPSGISADQYLNLSAEEKAAVLEKMLREGS